MNMRLFFPLIRNNTHSIFESTYDSDNLNYQTTKDGRHFLEVETPGFNKGNLLVNFDITKSQLTIEGKHENRSIKKSYFLGENVSASDLKIELIDGILTIFIEKHKAKSSIIPIKIV